MKSCFAAISLALLSASAQAAPPARVTVDAKGRLSIPAAVVKALKARPAANGMVCVQFPAPPVPARRGPLPPGSHPEDAPAAPRIWSTRRRDGSVLVTRTRVGTRDFVPGAPGTVYVAVGEKGRIRLARAAAKR